MNEKNWKQWVSVASDMVCGDVGVMTPKEKSLYPAILWAAAELIRLGEENDRTRKMKWNYKAMSMKPHEIFAEELHRIGWRSPCDAQWEKLQGLFGAYFGEVTGLRQEAIDANERAVKAEGTYRSQEIALTSLRARCAELEERDSVWQKKKEVLENDLAKAMEVVNVAEKAVLILKARMESDGTPQDLLMEELDAALRGLRENEEEG